ncbi:hypothetical protein NPIL_22361, partial [Nephila pilipes]
IHAEPAEGDQVGLRLVFTNVETEDAGTYTCSDDQDSVSFDLTVYHNKILNTLNEFRKTRGQQMDRRFKSPQMWLGAYVYSAELKNVFYTFISIILSTDITGH